MASEIKLKRSAVAGKAPATSDLELGELAMNTNDGKLFMKKDDGTESIVEITGGTEDYSSTQGYRNHSALIEFGSLNAGSELRIISADLQDIQYSTIAFQVDILDNNSNHGGPESLSKNTKSTYYVYLVRTAALALGDPDEAYISGPEGGDLVRARKISAGSYEVTLRNHKQYLELRVDIRVIGVNGSHSVTYHQGDAPSTASASYTSSAYSGNIDFFQRIVASSGSFSAPVGIGTTSPANLLQLNKSDSGSVYLHCTNSMTGTTANDGVLIGLSASEELTLYNRENNDIKFGTNDTERMRIDSAGNVGIGASSITNLSGYAQLALEDSNGGFIDILDDGVNQARIIGSGNELTLRAPNTGGEISFDTNGTSERMRIDSAGNIGIGTTSPQTKLEVDNGAPGGTLPTLGGLLVTNAGTSSTTAAACVATGAGPVFNVMNNGNIGIGTSAPIHPLVVSENGESGLEFNGRNSGPFIQSYNRSTSSYNEISYYGSEHKFLINTSEKLAVTSEGKVEINGAIMSSQAALQVNGFMRTGSVYIHEGGSGPTLISKELSNLGGVLKWEGATVWTSANDGNGSGLDADTLDGIGSGQFLRSDANDSFTGDLTGSGNILTSGTYMGITGDGGGVAMTTNDGYGNANVTFNHRSGKPDKSGSSCRIVANVDGTAAKLAFQLKSSTTANTAVSLDEILGLTVAGAKISGTLETTGDAGIGTDSPETRLHVYGSEYGFAHSDSSDRWIKSHLSSTSGYARLDLNGGGVAQGNPVISAPYHYLISYGTGHALNGEFAIKNGMGALGFYTGTAMGSPAEQLRIDATGDATFTNNVSIGGELTIPSKIMHDGDTDTYFQFHESNQCRIVIAGSEVMEWGNNYAQLRDGDYLRFGTGADFRMYWNGADMILRNYAHADGDIIFQGENSSGTNRNLLIHKCDGARPYTIIYENGSERFRTTSDGVTITGDLTATGDVTAFSDITLKKDIEVIPNALDKVSQIRGVTYERTDTEEPRRQAGVIAQEVEQVLPEVVHTNQEGIKSVAYGNLVSLLIESVKELKAQNEVLNNRLSQLEAKS